MVLGRGKRVGDRSNVEETGGKAGWMGFSVLGTFRAGVGTGV